MRCISGMARLVSAAAALSFVGGCATLTQALDGLSTPEPKQVKSESREPRPEGSAGSPSEKSVKTEPPVKAEARRLYRQALAALGAGRYPEAERALLAVIRLEPGLAGPRANLGIVYAHTGQAALAYESFKQAIQLNPDRAVYYNELGMVSRREGKFEEARRYYEKALDLDPNYAYAHLNVGILYDLYLQDIAKATQHYQRYRELTPSEAKTVTRWIADLQQRGRSVEQAKRGKSG